MKIAVVRDIKGDIGDVGLSYLVGGLDHEFYFSIQLGSSSSQLTIRHIFERGRSTTDKL
jgi:hypothetical protein